MQAVPPKRATGLRKEIKLLRMKMAQLHTEIAIYNQTLGLRGILAISANRICRYPKRLTLTAKGIKHPLFVRLGTSDAEVFEDIILRKAYDYPTSFSPRTIVDVGANCGITSVFYANRYPDATVVALEPETSNYAALIENTRAYPKVIPIQAALWNDDGQVEVFPGWPRIAKWGKWGFRVRTGNGCRALTLTTLMHEVGIDTVDILKIDVEGAEREIFSRCDWMDRVKLLAIELHDRAWPGCSDAVNAVTTGYHKAEYGYVTFYSR
jgi:FkbM family methyltransferase